MAVKYVIDDETMTQIADPLRSISGRTDELTPAEMAAAGAAANTEVQTQSGLIDQIKTVLNGKAGGGGGITPTGTIQITENGTYDVTSYASAEVDVPSEEPVLQSKSVTPFAIEQTVKPDSGYDGLSEVKVAGDANLLPEKIVENESIFGVVGSAEPASALADTATKQDELIADIMTALQGKAAGGITPTGTLEITENGTYDVTRYASAKVEVQGASGSPDPRDAYQRVEYIKSDGTAYILTDFVADNACGAEMVISFPHFADHTWMGSRKDSGSTRFFVPYAYSESIWYAGFNANVKISASTAVETIYRCQANFLNSRLTTIHDEAGTLKGSAALSEALTAQTYPACLFCQNYAGVPRTPRVFNFYSARCSRGYEIVREYIPCYRKSDGVVGVFEKFTGQFLTTPEGAFEKGADIDWEDAA